MQSHFPLLSAAWAEGQIRYSKAAEGQREKRHCWPTVQQAGSQGPHKASQGSEGWLLLKEQGRGAERSNKTQQ